MPDSPIAATPYQVLGVSPDASDDEVRRAYRRMLRQAHPDTGGDAALFTRVQLAYERIGTATGRASYDRGSSAGMGTGATSGHSWAQPAGRSGDSSSGAGTTRPRAKSFGHPGGWRRERYLALVREWVGRGTEIGDPYRPELVRSAPRDIRHVLADALAEEATARSLADLGLGWTVWHDVATGGPEQKIDHVVLGPTGLYAILSEDFGEPVRIRRGELVGEAIGASKPVHSLGLRAKALTRSMRIRFTALVICVPDDALEEPMSDLGDVRGAAAAVVRASYLPGFLRAGLPGLDLVDGTQLFDVRTKLQAGIRFV